MRVIVAGVGAKFNSDEFWRWSREGSLVALIEARSPSVIRSRSDDVATATDKMIAKAAVEANAERCLIHHLSRDQKMTRTVSWPARGGCRLTPKNERFGLGA